MLGNHYIYIYIYIYIYYWKMTRILQKNNYDCTNVLTRSDILIHMFDKVRLSLVVVGQVIAPIVCIVC